MSLRGRRKLIHLGGLVERGEGVHIFYYVATSLRQRMNMMRTQRMYSICKLQLKLGLK